MQTMTVVSWTQCMTVAGVAAQQALKKLDILGLSAESARNELDLADEG